MTALIDSGNSRLHFAWWDGGSLVDPKSIPYPESTGSLQKILAGLFGIPPVRGELKGGQFGGGKPGKAAACSVSAKWREPLFKALNDILDGELYVAVTASDIDLDVRYRIQSSYGIDRALASHAAYSYFQDSCVVIDAGTAVTVDAVAGDGCVAGGYIFPGTQTLARSLSEQTDLPEVSAEEAKEGIGTSTELCISYGLSMGVAGAVSRFVEYAVRTVGAGDRIIISGGGAEKMIKLLPFKAIHRRYLVIEGLGLSLNKLPKYA